MMLMQKNAIAAASGPYHGLRGLRTALPARSAAAGSKPRSVIMRFRENERQPFDLENLEEQLEQAQRQPAAGSPTKTRLSKEQLQEVRAGLDAVRSCIFGER